MQTWEKQQKLHYIIKVDIYECAYAYAASKGQVG